MLRKPYAQGQSLAETHVRSNLSKETHLSDALNSIAEMLLPDAHRGKHLPVRITWKESSANLPVIIFSHGAGASKDDYSQLISFWAEHGFFCIQPSHADSISLARQQGLYLDLRKILRSLSLNHQAWIDRVSDLSLIIDLLPEIERQAGLPGALDASRIGAGGHSFGAFTVQLLSGATLPLPDPLLRQRLLDKRVSAVLLLSAQGRSRQGFQTGSWDEMSAPMLLMTGSLDRGPKGQKPLWRTEPFHACPPKDKYLAFIEGANHLSFNGTSSGRLREPESPASGLNELQELREPACPEAPKSPQTSPVELTEPGKPAPDEESATLQESIAGYIQTVSLLFWNCYLKGDVEFKSAVMDGRLANQAGVAAKFLSR